MQEELRDSDFLSRYGGEEFALLAPQTDLVGATAIAEKLRIGIARSRLPVLGPHGRVSVTVSVGVALYDGTTTTHLRHRRPRALRREGRRQGLRRRALARGRS